MGLSDCTVGAVIAVSDMDLAREFYEGKLGLSGARTRPMEDIGIRAVAAPRSMCTRRQEYRRFRCHKPAGPSPTSRRWWMN